MERFFKNKSILVTGGCGSIGSAIVRDILNYAPKVVRVFDNNETGIFEFENELSNKPNVRFLLGDVRDDERVDLAMENIDIVFHAAALKHVPLCEYNPFEAVKTNVLGTENIIKSAYANNVEKVILISTDKVVNPVSTMGATKLLAEKIMSAAHYYKGYKKTVMATVRFGNVLSSSGSVVPLFENQISQKGPVTITNPDMTRFIMSTKRTIELVFKAVELMRGGEIFILKMPVIKIKDLADVMIENIAPKYGCKPKDIPIKQIGSRSGEKMHEELMTEDEASIAYETNEMFIILPQIRLDKFFNHITYPDAKKSSCKSYCSKDFEPLKRDAIKKMIFE